MRPEPGCTDIRQGAWLTAYELHLLAAREREAFESHLVACPACLEDIYAGSDYTNAMLSAPRGILERISRTSEALVPAAGVDSSPPSTTREAIARAEERGVLSRLRAWWAGSLGHPALAAVAALVLIGIGLAIYFQGAPRDQDRRRSPYGRLAEIEAVPYVVLETRAAGSSKAVDLYRDGMARYAERRYDEAVPRLRQSVESSRESTDEEAARVREQAQLYLGVSLLLEERPEEALGPLSGAASSPLPVVSDRAHWYLAQALLITGDLDAAVAHLARLAKNSPGYAARAAQQLEAVRQTRSR